MIRGDNGSEHFSRKLKTICAHSPYGVQIEAYFTSYKGRKYSFLDFWICSDGECAVCRYYDSVVICGNVDDELRDFLAMISPSSVLCDSQQKINIEGMIFSGGDTMQCVDSIKLPIPTGYNLQRLTGEMKPQEKIYKLIKASYSGNRLGSFDDFFVDASHKIRHGVSQVYVLHRDGIDAATLSVSAISDTTAVLGNIATLPEYRNMGLASYLVNYAASKLVEEGRDVFLFREGDVSLYEKAGFRKVGGWTELSK